MDRTILEKHLATGHPLEICLDSNDTTTDSGVNHRELSENNNKVELLEFSIEVLQKHHASANKLSCYHEKLDLYKSLDIDISKYPNSPYPTDDITRKGNYAEIILAEYVEATTSLQLPIYRLRYNPNINQSMKGDDVIAFDLDANPVRIIVGEAKFRKTPQKQAVIDAVDGLIRSNKAGLPISLHFVVDRLFELGEEELANKVLQCELLFLQDHLRIDYVGLLISDKNIHNCVKKHTENNIRNLLVISLAFDSPEEIVIKAYEVLETTL